MSELNVPPTKHSFMLLTPFHMPTPDGEKWAIALSARQGVLVSSAISVAMGLIITLLWNIFIFFTVLFQDQPFRRRYAALITLWNSNDPFSAFKEMTRYTWHYFSPPKEQQQVLGDHTGQAKADNSVPPPAGEKKTTATETISPPSKATESPESGSAQSTPQTSGPDQTKYPFRPSSWKRDCAYGLLLTLIAFIVYGGDKALGVVVPGLVVLGAVAPADPDSVYYPEPSEGNVDPAGILRNFGLKAPAVMRALGSVEAAGPAIRPKIQMTTTTTLRPWNGTEPMHKVTYSYSVSGIDFGLQRGSMIKLQVNGSCVTDYTWLREERPTADVYSVWGKNVSVPIDGTSIGDAPKASFLMPEDAAAISEYMRTGNTTYAVIIWSAHRASISMGSNPWYATETRGAAAPKAPFEAGFWMKRRRPVLSCWQKDTWTYGDQTANSVYELKRLPGIQIEQVLLKVLEAALFVPLVVKLGNASGDSALRSRTTSPNGVIDAGASSIASDMERLVLGSYVATKNVFADTTMYESNAGWPNLLRDASGQPAQGSADFVITSPDVLTFSLTGLIALAVILVFLVLVETLITVGASKLRRSKNLIQFKAMTAIQLFRIIFEPPHQLDAKWGCEDRFPRADDHTMFHVTECEKSGCQGHMDRTLGV